MNRKKLIQHTDASATTVLFQRKRAIAVSLFVGMVVTFASLFTGCTKPDPLPSEDTQLSLNVAIPGFSATRAGDDDLVAATAAEHTIYDLYVWAFVSGSGNDATAVSRVMLDNLSNSGSQSVTMSVPKTIGGVEVTNIDLYAIANVGSLTTAEQTTITNLGLSPARSAVEALTTSAFSTNPVTHSVPSTGLPASRILKNVALTDISSLTMELERAVSKIRFFFAKAADLEDNVQITNISFSAPGFPNKELVFPKQSGNDLVRGVNLPADVTTSNQSWSHGGTDANPLLGNAAVPVITSPLAHVKSSTQTEGEYITYLETNCANLAYDDALTYIRESGNTVTCTISYIIYERQTTTVKKNGSVEFLINNNVENGPFPRNYYAAVYGYFMDNSLFVRPVVMPWIWGGEYTYKTKTSAQLTVDNTYTVTYNYLLYNSDPLDYYDDGEGRAKRFDHCAISYGFDALSHRPLYSPWLKLVTTSGNTLKLQTNNPNFGFILYDKDTGLYSSTILDMIEIPVSKNRVTDFYVVPKSLLAFEGPEDAIRFVEVVLIEDMGVAGLQRLPYNHAVPRHESGETARFYYVRPGDYQDEQTETGATLTEKN